MRFFSFNLHIAVISDITDVMARIYGESVEIVDWNISNQYWLFYPSRKETKFINQETWKTLDRRAIQGFVSEYGEYLSGFDGFIVTHSPVFALLYESFNKPVILINSCRYEQPYSFKENNDVFLWRELGERLKCMHDKGYLVAVSNNKADQEYLYLGTGIRSIHIPSLCVYTRAKYNPASPQYLLYTGSPFMKPMENVVPKHIFVASGYSWKTLFSCRGIIHFPYEISTMSIFEQYSANIPLFMPSKELLKSMCKTGKYFLCSRYIRFDPEIPRYYPNSLKPALDDNTWIDFWVDRADFYDEDNMKHIVYYNSVEHLRVLLQETDTQKVSDQMREWNDIRQARVLQKWRTTLDPVVLSGYHPASITIESV
jgi:hypothetical protein